MAKGTTEQQPTLLRQRYRRPRHYRRRDGCGSVVTGNLGNVAYH